MSGQYGHTQRTYTLIAYENRLIIWIQYPLLGGYAHSTVSISYFFLQ